MAKQIITLGIGPIDSLAPFVLTGLDVAALNSAGGSAIEIKVRDKRAVVPFRDKRTVISGNN